MSDLTPVEKRKLEKFLGMETGWVLDFTNRTFADFISHVHPARKNRRSVLPPRETAVAVEAHVYLLESKWEKNPLPEADLLVFRGKIEGKSTFTRGVFIALNDVSEQARDAITRGKPPSFFVVNGYDLMMILSEAIGLKEFLRKRVRLLAEEGHMFVPFSKLA